jgi:hypothetical protein
MAQAVSCPDRLQLQHFLLGKVSVAEADQIETHLAHCTTCEHLLDTLYSRDVELEGVGPISPSKVHGAEQVVIDGLISKLKQLRSPRASVGQDTLALDGNRGDPSSEPTVDPALPAPIDDEITTLLSPAEQVGEIGRLGSYRILKILGVGGMGVVFQAEDPTLQRMVALKVMRPAMGRNKHYRARFLREARAMAALEHDHVVPIFQVGEDRDILFLALPMLKGETLEDRIAKVKFLGWPEILRIAGEIAKGLAAAHGLGIVHRDIKPSNLWLEAGADRVKILDFGLAHPVNDDGSGQERSSIAGTPAYMSPEQARLQPLDGRSDLFSLGCVLYRLCTERPAFEKPDKLSLMLSVMVDHPRPVQEVKADCPPELAQLVMKLLAKDPKDRPASAAVVAEKADTIRRRLLQAPLRRRLKAVAAVLLAGSLVWAGAAWGPWAFLFASNQAVITMESEDEAAAVLVKQGDHVVAELNLLKQRRLQLPAGNFQLEIAGDPDGLQLAAQALELGRGAEEKVIVRRVPLVRGKLLLDSGDDPLKVSLRRGGKQVVLMNLPAVGNIELPAGDYDVHLLDQPATLRAYPSRLTIEAGAKTSVRVSRVGEYRGLADPGAAVNSLAVDAQGKQVLAGIADRAVGLWSLANGQEAFYVKKHTSPVTAVALSPDGRWAISGGGEKGPKPDCTLRLWDVPQGKVLAQLDGLQQPVMCLAFARDPAFAFSGAGDSVTLWSLAEKKALRSWLAHEAGIFCMAVLPDGQHLITGGGDGQLHLWDLDTAKIVRSFVGHSEAVRGVVISTDGTRLASASWDGTVRSWDVATAKESHVFRGHRGWVSCVAFSPDGKRILSGGADKSVRLWDVELCAELLRLDGHTATVQSLAFLPDGRHAVSGGKDQQIRLWKLP